MARRPKGGGLGRGLDALFADSSTIEREQQEDTISAGKENPDAVVYININDIKPNKSQPRKSFDPEKISELAASILEHGIIQPLVVRKAKVGYELVAGERRWRAAREAKLKEIPCLIREFTDEENMLVAIIENMQREDLNPIEEAEGLGVMIDTYGLTHEQAAKSVSKSRAYISNALRLLNLPDQVRACVASGELSAGHARAILGVANPAGQVALCQEVLKQGLSVRETEKRAKGQPRKRGKAVKRVKNADVRSVESDLTSLFGAKVSINAKGRGGTIEITYSDAEELNRLIDSLKTARP
ncbi:MAG: ParB/RepB/Spo0J family partition protein [Clostridia bacterium]|nr:ParB/RepB/Spo0J family partition protein [Clostridia bacterium]